MLRETRKDRTPGVRTPKGSLAGASPAAELRRQARRKIAALSADRLRVAVDFLTYLQDRESVEATEELLRIPHLIDDLRRAEGDAKAGRTVNWRNVRRDV